MEARAARAIWVVFDPLKGTHVFRSKKDAWRMYSQWVRMTGGNPYDPFWDMSEPVKYVQSLEQDAQ